MSILGKIFGKIFPSAHADQNTAAQGTAATPAANATAQPNASQAAQAPTAGAAPAQAPMQQVDVEAVLNGMASKNPEKLNWKTSIVDLMKLLGLDSSLSQRKELATELGYTGDMNDSASMNIWLHKQVMNKLAANGGKVPADLKG